MNRGTWIIKDGKKIAAVRDERGVPQPIDKPKATPKPKPKAKEE